MSEVKEIKKVIKDKQFVQDGATATLTVDVPPPPPKEHAPIKLNLGCGFRKHEGFINIDMRELVKPDLLHDITKPFPYADSSVDFILADDILEHVLPDDVVPMLWELHRILKPDGVLQFSIPSTDGRGAFMDPTHRSFWNIGSWLYFTDGEWHALYPDLPLFKLLSLSDVTTSVKYRIVHTVGKISPVK